MSKIVENEKEKILCDLEEGCWDEPCPRTKCKWNISDTESSNCFLLYKYTINNKPHTLYTIAKVMDISHTKVKQIENEAREKLEDTDLGKQLT